MTINTVSIAPGRLRARAFVSFLRLVGAVSRPFRHKGLWHAAHYLGRVGGRGEICTVQVGRSSRFSFPCDDAYWVRMVVPSYVYESEIQQFLNRLRGERYAFLDCGSNFGLWSIVCSEPGAGAEQVVAIEASSANLAHLLRNWEINQKRFEVLHRAIYSQSGMTVRIQQEGSNHAGASIDTAATGGLEVETVTIDDLTSSRAVPEVPWIIKLDVEGVEIPALEGAARTLQSAAIIIYEDHGNDLSSKVTQFVRETLGLDVYFKEDGGSYVPIASAEDATRYKSSASIGYNFFAVTPAARAFFERVAR